MAVKNTSLGNSVSRTDKFTLKQNRINNNSLVKFVPDSHIRYIASGERMTSGMKRKSLLEESEQIGNTIGLPDLPNGFTDNNDFTTFSVGLSPEKTKES